MVVGFRCTECNVGKVTEYQEIISCDNCGVEYDCCYIDENYKDGMGEFIPKSEIKHREEMQRKIKFERENPVFSFASKLEPRGGGMGIYIPAEIVKEYKLRRGSEYCVTMKRVYK